MAMGLNKRGGEEIFTIYWFVILVAVAGVVSYMVVIFYGQQKDIRGIEENLLSNKIAVCLSEGGYLKEGVLSEDFKNNFLEKCNLNLDVESDFEEEQGEYYTEISISKFNADMPEMRGEEITNIRVGNINLRTLFFIQHTEENLRKRNVELIVIHYTEGPSAQSAISWLEQRLKTSDPASVHYIIDRDGRIYSAENSLSSAFVDEENEAWHAGCEEDRPLCHSNTEKPDAKKYPLTDADCCRRGINKRSIGIELVNLGDRCGESNTGGLCDLGAGESCKTICEDTGEGVEKGGRIWQRFSDEQMNSLKDLVSGIASRYNIPVDREHIIGHHEVDPPRKYDPGIAFPWEDFIKGIVPEKVTSKGVGRDFYVLDRQGNRYIIKILALVRKTEKNE